MIAVLIVVTTAGLGDADARALSDKLDAEVRAQGGEPAHVDVDAGCLDDAACVARTLANAHADALVSLDVTRAGSFVQLALCSIDTDGKTLASDERATKMDALKRERLLPDGALPKPAVIENAPARTESTPPRVAPPPLAPEAPTPAPAVEHAPATSPMLVAGLATIGAGALALIGGTSIAVLEYGTIRDPASLGEEKVRAATMVPIMGAVALAGAAGIAVGAVLIAVE